MIERALAETDVPSVYLLGTGILCNIKYSFWVNDSLLEYEG